MSTEYHLTRFDACEPHWPKGGWAVYHISGDQIADRIRRDPTGKVVERHSWCGFLGIAETISGVQEIIDRDMNERIA